MGAGISAAWTRGSTDKSQAAVYDQVRGGLIAKDSAVVKQYGPGGVTGNMIDSHHNQVFTDTGVGALFYGGNLWPQGVWPNPVPLDRNGKSQFDPRLLMPKSSSSDCQCGAN